MDVASKGVILKCVRQEKYLKERIWCIREDYSASPHPGGPLLKQRYPPWSSRQSIAHQVTSSSLIPWRIMVHPGGFEPPTARFVAEYSIQLSYGCIGDIALLRFTSSLLIAWRNMVHPGGFEPPTARFVAEYSIQLSYGCIGDTALLRFTSSLLIPWRNMVHPGGLFSFA